MNTIYVKSLNIGRETLTIHRSGERLFFLIDSDNEILCSFVNESNLPVSEVCKVLVQNFNALDEDE